MSNQGTSKASSNNETSTTTQDNKVSATDSGIALGNGASLTYTDSFSPEVKQAFGELVGLVRDTLNGAKDLSSEALKANQASLASVNDTAKTAIDAVNLKDQALFKSAIPYAGVALVVFAFFSRRAKK